MADKQEPGEVAPRRLLLVDGPNYYYRAYHAIHASMSAPDGTQTNALFGVARMLLQMLTGPAVNGRVVFVFDPPGGTFRDKMFPQYKAHRSEMPPELRQQIPLIHEMLATLGVPDITVENYEADDVIATLATVHSADYDEVWLVSGDKDLMQLVGGNVYQYEGMNEVLYDRAAVKAKWDVWPEQISDLLGLMGDSSDNIPGVPGIGKMTAAKLLKEYGTLEAVLAAGPTMPGKKRENMVQYAQQGRDGKMLATLVRDVDLVRAGIPFDVRFGPLQREQWQQFCARVGFGRIRSELEQVLSGRSPKVAAAATPSVESAAGFSWSWDVVQPENAAALMDRLGNPCVLDLETTGLNPRTAQILGVALADRADHGYYMPIQEGVLPPALLAWLADPAKHKTGQNLKYDISVLEERGAPVRGVHGDSMIAHILLEPLANGHGLDAISAERLGHTMISFESVTRGTLDFGAVQLDEAAKYASEDACVVAALLPQFERELAEQGLARVYHELEVPLIPVVSAMERAGIRVDLDTLRQIGRDIDRGLREGIAQIEELAGGSFNLNSTQQLSEILFERLKLPTKGVPRTKAGLYSTKAEVLEQLEDEHPIIPRMLEYRQLEKLRSTYIEPLAQMVDARTGRVHTSFQQIGAATGRMSSTEPNLQNIPIRDAWGKRMREAFVAEPGNVLLSADYSQIELRVFAHMTGDPGLVEAFESGQDIHARTAAQMFNIPLANVTKEDRSRAKAINFGLLYGMGARRLGKSIGVTQHEAKALIDQYFAQFPLVRAGMDKILHQARETGAVRTLLGRRRPVPDIRSGTPMQVAGAERVAVNSPVQGTAADIIKLAMLSVDRLLREQFPQARLLLQVHDELVLEAPESLAPTLSAALKQAMESVLPLAVPLVVEVGYGPSWAAAH